jgi:TRAP-type C4-dicarboxylate transport system substrate-binding protein
MEFNDEIEKLPEDLQKIIKNITTSWAIEGYNLSKEDERILIDIASGKVSCGESVQKLIDKYKRKG